LELPNNISDCHEVIKVLLKKLELFEERILAQNELIQSQREKIAELEDRLNKNSRNSNKPPSSDGYQKKPALPKKNPKKQGGQIGHTGKNLEMVSLVDHSITLGLVGQCSCGCNLSNLKTSVKDVRQVFDLPEPELEVTEYIQLEGSCNCGKHHQGIFPSEVQAPTQYGHGVRALTTLLTNDYNLSVSKTQGLFADLFGYAINEATIQNNNERCHNNLAETESIIKQVIINSPVSHYDETGLRVAGRLHWLHVACTNLFTFLYIHPKRGKQAMEDGNVLAQVKGWVVHDCWPSYFDYDSGKHALCIAHLIRELTALHEKGNPWAILFINFLFALYESTDQGKSQLDNTAAKQARVLYRQIYKYADEIEPKPVKNPRKRGRPKATKGRNLLNRLIKHKDAVLAFAFHTEVPFTNNLAERAVRPAKIKQKVSGCLRTFKGAKRYARICSFIQTTRKHKRNVFNELKNIFKGQSFIVENANS